jgi:hypothetical protein
MDRMAGGAVSANLLGECMHPDRAGARRLSSKRNVGDGPHDVKPKVVFLARNFSVITVSNAKLCSERCIRGEGYDYHGRLDAKTAVELLAAEDIDVQPQGRCVVGEHIAPAIFSFNVTTFGPSVEKNHLEVCTELQRPWQEDMEYMEVLRVQHNNQRAEHCQQLKTEQPVAYAAKLEQRNERYQQLKTEQPKAYAAALNAGKNRAAERRKKKKKKKPPCPGSVHGPGQPCTVPGCDSIWCDSK